MIHLSDRDGGEATHRLQYPKKRKGEVYKILVSGAGHFPYDMLRYDQSWPATESDSARLDSLRLSPNSLNLIRSVELASLRYPTVERWKSFGWDVTEVR